MASWDAVKRAGMHQLVSRGWPPGEDSKSSQPLSTHPLGTGSGHIWPVISLNFDFVYIMHLKFVKEKEVLSMKQGR